MKAILKKIKCLVMAKKLGLRMVALLKVNFLKIKSKGLASKLGKMEVITKDNCKMVFSTGKENTFLRNSKKHTLDPSLTERWKAKVEKYGLMEESILETSNKE